MARIYNAPNALDFNNVGVGTDVLAMNSPYRGLTLAVLRVPGVSVNGEYTMNACIHTACMQHA